MGNGKNVTVVSISRFHLFRMSEFLFDKGYLNNIVTAYPSRVALKKWPFMKGKLSSVTIYAFFRIFVIYSRRLGFIKIGNLAQKYLHSLFSFSSSKRISDDSKIIIGLSSFMEEVMNRSTNQILIVDHGSLHISTERDELLSECIQFGFKPFGNWQHEWLISKMEREFAMADYIFCCSQLAKKTMIDNGVDESKIFVNPLGVDLSSFYIDELKFEKKTNKPFRFLHVSNMSPLKGLHYIIDAFNSFNDTECELWLVGPYPTEPLLQDKIKSNSRIKYHGYVDENELVKIYNQCDVFLHPSLSDGWAMTVLQAMASGLPVVVSNMTGVKEVIEDGYNGWVVKSKNLGELSNIMEHCLNNRDQLNLIGRHAALTVSNNYGWSDYGKRLTDFIESIKGN